MALTLTSASITARKSIRYGIYFMVLFMIARMALQIGIRTYKQLVPAPPPPPTLGFNVLPKIAFSEVTQTYPQFEFKVETATGTFPEFPITMKVYAMPKQLPTLNSVDTATAKARSMGFATLPIKVTETLYRYVNATVPSSLEINLVTGVFSASYNLASDPTPLSVKPPTTQVAKDLATGILSNAQSLPADLTGEPKYEFLKVEGEKLVTALSLSDANLVRVNLFRKTFEENEGKEKYPSLPANPNQGNVWFIISGAQKKEQQMIAAEFHYYPIDETRFETYPVKSAQQAFTELTEGKGYIANLGLNQEGKVTIRKVYLAYYDPDMPSQFYQPIVVFEGDRGFFAYVPAITSDWYQQ